MHAAIDQQLQQSQPQPLQPIITAGVQTTHITQHPQSQVQFPGAPNGSMIGMTTAQFQILAGAMGGSGQRNSRGQMGSFNQAHYNNVPLGGGITAPIPPSQTVLNWQEFNNIIETKLQKKFKKYLEHIHRDLCIKHASQGVSQFALLKYSNLPGYLSQRLYNAMLHLKISNSQNGMKVNHLQNSMPPPDAQNDQQHNHFANIMKRENYKKSNLINEKQFVHGLMRIYMAIDDEIRAQLIFDIFDVNSQGFITQEDTKILLYHSLDWRNIQLQNHAVGGNVGFIEGLHGSNQAYQNSPQSNNDGNGKYAQNIPPVICDEYLSSGQQSPNYIEGGEGNQINQFGFSIPNVQPQYNRSALLFSEMLGGSHLSLSSDKRVIVSRVIEQNFGQKNKLTFAEFRIQARNLHDLIFTQLILNLPCSLYFNTAKVELENNFKEATQQQQKMIMMQNQNVPATSQAMPFHSQLPLDALQSIGANKNHYSIPQRSGMINQMIDNNIMGNGSHGGRGGTLLVSASNQDGTVEMPQHSFNKQHSFVLGVSQLHNKESYNNLGPNFLLPLNKAVVRTDNGEGAGSNMAQLLRSVLANQNQQQQQHVQNQKLIQQPGLPPSQLSQQQPQQLIQISQNNNAKTINLLQVTPSNLLINSSGEQSANNVLSVPTNNNIPPHSTKAAMGQSHEILSKTLNSNTSPKNNNKEIGKHPSNVAATPKVNPIGSQQQNISSQAMIMMRPRDPQGGAGRQSKIFYFKTGEEFKQIQVNKSDESSPLRRSDQEKLINSPEVENSQRQQDFIIKIRGIDEERKEAQQPGDEVEVLESDCSLECDLAVCNEFQHQERQSIMLQVNIPYYSQINSNYEHMKSSQKDQQFQWQNINHQNILDDKMSNFDESVFQSPHIKNKVQIIHRKREFSGILLEGNMGSFMSGFTPHDFGSGIVQNSFADHMSAMGSILNARGYSQNPVLRRNMVTPLQKMFNDKINPSQMKIQKSSFYNPSNNRGGSMSPFRDIQGDNNQLINTKQNVGKNQNFNLRQPLTMKNQHVTMPDDVHLEKILSLIPIQKKPMEGHVYLKISKDQSMQKFFLVVSGNDIYCYTSEAKRYFKFMHSLFGCFVQELPQQVLPLMPSVPNCPSETFYPVELRLSHICKKVIYFSDDSNRQLWIKCFRDACDQLEFGDFYRMGDYIAEGSFGKVFKGYHRDTGRLVAVKQISKNKMEENELEVQQNEIELLKVIDHPNVVQLIDNFEDPHCIYLVLEHLQGYNLMKIVNEKQVLNEKLVKRIMKDIFTGLSYLHQIGIVHRDIKLDNIMMNLPTLDSSIEYAIPKIIDFGLATVLMPKETRTEGFGTIAYCSPEIILRKPYTCATDVWSIGVVFYVLLSGLFPFLSFEKRQVVKNILHARIQLDKPQVFQNVSKESKNLLQKMLIRDYKLRITAQQILQDVWFQSNEPI